LVQDTIDMGGGATGGTNAALDCAVFRAMTLQALNYLSGPRVELYKRVDLASNDHSWADLIHWLLV